MSLISVKCYQLIILTLAIYYLLPLRYRWIALLAASVSFYAFCGFVIDVVKNVFYTPCQSYLLV